MNQQSTLKPDFTATTSWADRLETYRDTDWLMECLESIRDEAKRVGDLEYFWACQYALDADDLSDLDGLIADELASEEPEESPRAWFDAGAQHPDRGAF